MLKMERYSINEETMAFIPNFNEEYVVKILERERKIATLVKETAIEMIDKACKQQLSDIRSRRNAVKMYLPYYQKKLPIVIDVARRIYAIPTESPDNMTCHWLFLSHIHKIVPLSTRTKEGKKRSRVIFKDKQELIINTSYYSLMNQLQRALHCKAVFEDLVLSGHATYKIIAETKIPYIGKQQ